MIHLYIAPPGQARIKRFSFNIAPPDTLIDHSCDNDTHEHSDLDIGGGLPGDHHRGCLYQGGGGGQDPGD